MGIKFPAIGALLLSLTVICAADKVVLVDRGKAKCTIVTGKDDGMARILTCKARKVAATKPANVLAEAADDLAKHLNNIGQVPFHIHVHKAGMVKVVRNITDAKTKYRILLGAAAIEKYGLQKEAGKLSYAGYVYRTVGNDLLIFGASSKGTANGVYGFLQDELGVRWFGPQELFTVIPKKDGIRVGPLNKKVEPSLYGRNGGSHYEGDHPHNLWIRRMRQGDGKQPFDQASHNLWRMFPANKYYKTHPEYYFLVGEKRQIWGGYNWGLCWSNPELADLAANKAEKYFCGGRFNDSFSLGINDCASFCECKECAKLQPARTFRGARVASDMYYHFVNKVARRVAKKFPDRFIGVIAYNDVKAPPVGPMEKNIFVVLVNDISQHFDKHYRKTDEDLVKAWEKKNITLGMYYYISMNIIVPFYFPHLLAKELKDKYKRGFKVFFTEENIGPMGYVNYRLWWDINLDVDQLLDEYFTKLYGPAARYMKELYALLEEIHMRSRKGGFLYESGKLLQFRPYTKHDLIKIRKLLAKAHAAIKGMGVGRRRDARPEERRLAYTSNNLKVFLNMLEGLVLARELKNAKGKLDDIEVLRRLDKIRRLNAILSKNKILYRETLILDPYASAWHRWETNVNVRHAWKTYLSEVIGEALVNIYRAVQPPRNIKLDTRIEKRLDSIVSDYRKEDLRSALFNYRTGKLKAGKNLILNPGFETGDNGKIFLDQSVFIKRDWGNAKPFGWAFYPPGNRGSGTFGVSDKEKHSGNRSALLRGIGNGCYLTLVENLKSGQIYHMAAYIKNTAHVTRTDVPVANLKVSWLNENYDWTAHSLTSSKKNSELDKWVKLEQVVRIPDGAEKAVVQIYAGPLYGEEKVYLDDVSFRLLK